MSSQPLRRRFAESIGCTVLVHCPEPWVEPSSAPGQQWIAQQRLPDGYQTVTMNNLPIEQVEKAWAAYFEWAHRPFGSVHTDRLPLYWSHYSRGLDADASMLSIGASKTIVALSLVTPDAWDARTMIVSEPFRRTSPTEANCWAQPSPRHSASWPTGGSVVSSWKVTAPMPTRPNLSEACRRQAVTPWTS